MAREKWLSRDLPILETIAAIEDRGDPFTSFEEVVEGTGFDEDDVRLGLQALYDAAYITGEVPDLRLDQIRGVFHIDEIRLLEDGRVVTGQWPSSDPFAGLIAVLDAHIASASSSDRPALVRLRETLFRVGEKVGTEVILDLYRRLRDGTPLG